MKIKVLAYTPALPQLFQFFLNSSGYSLLTGEISGITMIYLIHPALTKSIEQKIRNRKNILHFNAFIIGKGLTASKDDLQKIMADKLSMSKREFEAKYYN